MHPYFAEKDNQYRSAELSRRAEMARLAPMRQPKFGSLRNRIWVARHLGVRRPSWTLARRPAPQATMPDVVLHQARPVGPACGPDDQVVGLRR